MTTIVKSEGSLDAPICLVGEAPGRSEEDLGRPFVGVSGKLLTTKMAFEGILRSDCYITNVVKERPPNNDITSFVDLKTRNVKTSQEFENYKIALHEELKQVKANVIVAVGEVALYALLGLRGITKWRGSILNYNGRKVIPIIHPSSALREYLYEGLIQIDLSKIKKQSAFPEIVLPQRFIKTKPTFEETCTYLQEILDSKEPNQQIGFDIEVYNKEIGCLAVAKTATDIICIPFMSNGHNYFDPDQEVIIWDLLAEILETRADIAKVGQNLSFDATFILRKMNIHMRNLRDTMIAHAILAPDHKKDLGFLTSIYTDEPYYKDDGKIWFKYGGSEESFWRYNALDAAVCLEILPKVEEHIKQLGNQEIYEQQTRLIQPLLFFGDRGIQVLKDKLKERSTEIDAQIAEIRERLRPTMGDVADNLDSPKALATFFYITLGHKPYVDRKTGNVTTDVTAITRLIRKGIKEAYDVGKYRKLSKEKNTYVEMDLDDDNRIRAAWNPVGTKQGRVSSGKTIFKTGMNMQNLPHSFLKYLIVDPGYLGFEIDLSQAENRVVAYIAPDQNMIRAFENKIDLHGQTASWIFQEHIDKIIQEDQDDVHCDIGTGEFTKRFWGKKANHGFNYDFGYRAFALLYELSEKDSKRIHEIYHIAYPGVHNYHRWVKDKLSKDRILINCLGRKRLFLDRWGDDLFKEAYSFIPQSTVADKMNKDGLLEITENPDIYERVEMLKQVHDSIKFQIPLDAGISKIAFYIDSVVKKLEEDLSFDNRTFSIPADTKVGTNFGKMTKVKKWSCTAELEEQLDKYIKTLIS